MSECGCCDDAARFPGSGERPCPACGHTVVQCNATDARPCPRCNGTGETGPVLACGPTGSTLLDKAVCWVCRGRCVISAEQAGRMEIGQRVRTERLRQHIHQGGLAASLGIDKVAYSQAESLGIGDRRTFDQMGAWLDAARATGRRGERGEGMNRTGLIERGWRLYAERVLPKNASKIQIQESRRVWYASAAHLFEALADAVGPDSISEDDGMAIFERVQGEIDAHLRDVLAGRR